MNNIDLKGRVAIITGGATGIGYATARRFLQSGAIVELWGRTESKLLAARSTLSPLGEVSVRTIDVSHQDQVVRGAGEVESSHGRIDILFNCAGVTQKATPTTELTADAWHQDIAVNLHGVFYCCQAVLPTMLRQRYGRIINASSMAGKEGNPFTAAYSAAKAGVIGLTKSLGKEYATTGVIVNGIAPTLFDTPLARWAIEQAPPGVFDQIIAKIPMSRIGLPEEAAALVAWLASEECSFSTGFTFDLSGGRATY